MSHMFTASVHIASALDRQIVVGPLRERMRAFIDAGLDRQGMPRIDDELLEELPFIENFVAAMDDPALDFFTRHVLSILLQDPVSSELGLCELEFGFCADSDRSPDPLAVITLQYVAIGTSVAYIDHRCVFVDRATDPATLDELEGELTRLGWPEPPFA